MRFTTAKQATSVLPTPVPVDTRGMDAALLILVLAAGDPASGSAAKAIADGLRLQRADARLVLPPDAVKLLAERGLADADLVHRSEKPILATAKEARLVVVRVERRDSGPDQVVDIDLWAGGRRDGTTAVAGAKGDPVPAAVESACRLLREASLDPAEAAARADQVLIATFADKGDWTGLVAAVARQEKPSPRLRAAGIAARLRLGDRAGAHAELDKLRAAAPDSTFTRDVAAAIEADAGGADVLRDPPKGDDGGNVLH